MQALNCLKPSVEPKATEHIAGMQAMARELIEKDIAYLAPDGTAYYAVETKADYGKLSGRKLEDQQAGARVEVDANKKHPSDFALWKPETNPEELAWDDPENVLPRGRPGWHIECSAMIRAVFEGQPIEIHAGGQDLIFPHHENEIAQSEGCCGEGNFVKHWMHNGFVNVSGDKMSKSTGNFKTIQDLLKRYSPNAIRYFILTQKYDKPIDFTEDDLASAERWVKKFSKTMNEGKLAFEATLQQLPSLEASDFPPHFYEDLNTPLFLAELNQSLKQLKAATEKKDLVALKTSYARALLLSESLLGIVPQAAEPEEEAKHFSEKQVAVIGDFFTEYREAENPDSPLEEQLACVLAKRVSAKKAKDFATADTIRNALAEVGIQLKDTREGTTYELVE